MKQKLSAAANLTLVASDYHFAALTIAQADDPASMAFLLMGMLSFVMVTRQNVITRWSLVIVPMGLFLFFNSTIDLLENREYSVQLI